MAAHSFTVEERPVPGKPEHVWVAIDDADRAEIPLPRGGSGVYLGRYPELAGYLAAKGVECALDFTPRRGDIFEPDYENDVHTFTFDTAGGIVVKDIPRTVGRVTIQY